MDGSGYVKQILCHNGQAPAGITSGILIRTMLRKPGTKLWKSIGCRSIYIGGVEHAVLHLLYARFWHKVLYDCGLVSTKEPFQKLFNQGMVLANSFRDAKGKYYYPHQVEERNGQWFVKETNVSVETQVEKMSKSRLNVYSLDSVIDQYGADALRLYELFIGPLSASGPWLMSGIEGVSRFLQRTWRFVVDERTGKLNDKLTDAPASSESELQKLLHRSIKSVTESIESIDKMNTVVSQLMTFSNLAAQTTTLPKEIIKDYLLLLAPLAPHIAEELWSRLGENGLISHAAWPKFDEELVRSDSLEMIIQVNGKTRSVMTFALATTEAEIRDAAYQRVSKFLEGKAVKNTIYVRGKFVNFVAQ